MTQRPTDDTTVQEVLTALDTMAEEVTEWEA